MRGKPVDAGDWQELNVTQQSTTIGGLTPGTKYKFRVSSQKGGTYAESNISKGIYIKNGKKVVVK